MKHSSRQVAREEDLARQNREYLEQKRALKRELAPPLDLDDENEKKKRSKKPYFCVVILVVLVLAAGFIYYLVVNVKDSMYRQYLDGKVKLEQVMPEAKDELTKSVDQGQALVGETKATVESVQQKVDTAKNTYNQAKGAYDQMMEVYNKIKGFINGTNNANTTNK